MNVSNIKVNCFARKKKKNGYDNGARQTDVLIIDIGAESLCEIDRKTSY